MEYTDAVIEKLRRLWDDGYSSKAIARIMGPSWTKNMVVGIAHRRSFPSRPTPIRSRSEDYEPKPQAPKRVYKKATLPALESAPGSPVPEGYKPIRIIAQPRCSWPIGMPGQPGFHFCSADSIPGKPYCAEHCAIAYVKPTKPTGLV